MSKFAVSAGLAVVVLAACAAPDPAVREQRITAGGELFVRTGGSGPNVVMLHGLGDSSVGWHWIEQPLRDAGFRVTVWDALGCGRSARPDPGDYGLAAHVDRLRAVLDELAIDRAHLIGNSLGGTIALLFAQAHPGRVDRIVLLNPAAYPEGGTTPKWFWQVPGLAESVLARLPAELLARTLLRYLFGDARRVREEDVRLYAAEAERHQAMRGLILQQRQLYPEPAVIERWVAGHKAVAAQALILWGAKDRILPLEQAHRLARDLPHARLQLLDSVGHVPQLEVPDDVLVAANAFLRD